MKRKTRSRPGLWMAACLLALAAAAPCWAVKGLKPDGSLDRPAISKAYFEGESWTVINALEAFRKGSWRATRDDSLYVLKYLGVTYAADPGSRAKAEACLGQLVRMEPGVDLQDLYLPESVQAVFQAVKGSSAGTATAAPDPGASAPAPAGEPPAPPTLADLADSVPSAAAEAPASSPDPALAALPDSASRPASPSRRLWPLALGGAGVAAVTVLLVALGSDTDSERNDPRPVQVTLEWPKEGSR